MLEAQRHLLGKRDPLALRTLLDGALRRLALELRFVADATAVADAGAVKTHVDRMRHSLTLATTAYHQLEPAAPDDPEFCALIRRYEELSQAAQPVLAAGLALLAR